jgi:hypothetical protein
VVGVRLAQDAGLLEEPLPDVDPLGPVLGERLDGDVGAQLRVVVEPDRREPADAEPLDPAQATEAFGERRAG